MQHPSEKSASSASRWSQLLGIIAVAVSAAVLGHVSAKPAMAGDAATTYKCQSTNQGCNAGSHENCSASCGPSGCKCSTTDPQV